MNILKLAGILTLDGTRFKAGLKEAEVATSRSVSKISGDFKAMAASYFGYGAFKALVGSVVDRAMEIKNAAKQFTVSTTEVQELGRAAHKSGLEFSDFGSALNKLASTREEAADSNDKLLSIFNKYGVSLKELENPAIRNIDLIKKIGAAMKDTVPTPEDQAAFRSLFGKSGETLIAAFQDLARQGPISVISEQTIKNITDAKRELDELWKVYQRWFAPHVASGASMLANMTKGLVDDEVQDRDEEARNLRRHYEKAGNGEGRNIVNAYIKSFAPGGTSDQQEGAYQAMKDYAEGLSNDGRGLVPSYSGYGHSRGGDTDKMPKDEKSEETQKREHEEYIADLQRAEAARDQLSDAAFKYQMSLMETPEGKRALLRGKMNWAETYAQMQAADYGDDSVESYDAQRDIIGLLEQFHSLTPKPTDTTSAGGFGGDQSALARVGQWQGINYQNSTESPVVAAARALLEPSKETAKNTALLVAMKPQTLNVRGR